ncbi:MAG: hypothetical protein QE263_02285 [Vampirovibrionales bacterium]|nr:hypothetical protein [Vampirovibrionales bacterium]
MLRLAFPFTTSFKYKTGTGPTLQPGEHAMPNAEEVMGRPAPVNGVCPHTGKPWVQSPISLQAAVWDTFRTDNSEKLGNITCTDKEETVYRVFTHGTLVAASVAYGLWQQGVNPAGLQLTPFESFQEEIDRKTSVCYGLAQAAAMKAYGTSSTGAVGVVCSVASMVSLTELKHPVWRTWETKHLLNKVAQQIEKLKRWPCFFANNNVEGSVSTYLTHPKAIGIAETCQKKQQNHDNYVDMFTNDLLEATVIEEDGKTGLDFGPNPDGKIDYYCTPLNKKAIGKRFQVRGNSFTAPKAFGQYVARVIKHLDQTTKNKKQTQKQAQKEFKSLNLYDFAFPDPATYEAYKNKGHRLKETHVA